MKKNNLSANTLALSRPSVSEIYGVVAFVISPNYPDAVHPNDELGADWHMSSLAKRGLAKPLNDEFRDNIHQKLNGKLLLTQAQALAPDQTGGCTTVFDIVESIRDHYDI